MNAPLWIPIVFGGAGGAIAVGFVWEFWRMIRRVP